MSLAKTFKETYLKNYIYMALKHPNKKCKILLFKNKTNLPLITLK